MLRQWFADIPDKCLYGIQWAVSKIAIEETRFDLEYLNQMQKKNCITAMAQAILNNKPLAITTELINATEIRYSAKVFIFTEEELDAFIAKVQQRVIPYTPTPMDWRTDGDWRTAE